MKYYRLFQDLYDKEAWTLNVLRLPDGNIADEAYYRAGNYINKFEKLTTTPMQPHKGGNNLHKDFSIGGPFVSERLANVMTELAGNDIQLIPIEVEGVGDFYILNILRIIECFDFENSIYELHDNPTNSPLKILYGTPKNMMLLKFDTKKTEGHHIFRIAEYPVPIIVSDDMKSLIESHGFKGMTFTETNTDEIDPFYLEYLKLKKGK